MNIEKKKSIIEESLGKKFSKLTVQEFVEFRKTPRGANVPIIKCKCECGKTKVMSLWDVRSGKTKTCGFNHPHYEDRSMPAFNRIYDHSYKKRAIQNGWDFTLSRKTFRNLTQQDCHYCGSPPTRNTSVTTTHTISEYKYNGLDRIDSSKGYTLDNVVPCCGVCNHAKHTMPYKDFIGWLDRIVKFRSKSKLKLAVAI